MRTLLCTLLALGMAAPAAAAYEDVGLPETLETQETAASAKNGDEDEAQPLLQESDEDLAAFVTDYIRKDIQLKGAFLIEDKASKKLLKLELVSVDRATTGGDGNAKAVTARFKDAAGKAYSVLFWVQSGPWGGLDIFKIDLKPAQQKAPEKK